MRALALLESISVNVQRYLTSLLRRKYEFPYDLQAVTPAGSLVKLMVPYFTRSKSFAAEYLLLNIRFYHWTLLSRLREPEDFPVSN